MHGREDENVPAGEENNGNRKRSVPPIAPHALDSLCDALFNGLAESKPVNSEDSVATTSFPAGETPGAAVQSVILEPAFTWCCPKCHGINFELPIVAELTEEQREEIQEEYGENPIGKWTVAPDTVECKHCKCEFDAIDFELIDEDDDGEDEDDDGDFIDDGSELDEFGNDDDEDSFDNFLADVDRQFDDGEDGESWKRAGEVDDGEREQKKRRQRNSKQIDERVIDEANRELSEVAEDVASGGDEQDASPSDELQAEYADDIGPDHITDDGSPIGQREEEVDGERGDSGNGSIAERIVNGLESYAKQLREEDEIGDAKPGTSLPAGNPRSGKSEVVSLPKFETEWIIANPFGIGWIPGGM